MKKKNFRLINNDGSSNIIRQKNDKWTLDLYHSSLSISWKRFLFFTFVIYLGINFLFALIYFIHGADGLSGVKNESSALFLIECFFFSVQTFSTIGYGAISPHSLFANIIVSIQALTGLVSVGLMSGLFFARFSRPTSKIIHSKIALLTKYDGKNALVFRIANARYNQIIDAHLSVTILKDHITNEGVQIRRMSDLELVRPKTLVFALSWTVVHIIDEHSPLLNLSIQDLEKLNAEIFVLASGHDETFNQLVFSRFSYTAKDLVIGRQFEDILHRDNGKVRVDIQKISELKNN